MRSFAIEEPGSPVPALYATLPINDFFCRKENSHPWPVSHRVNHDYLVEQTELEEDLFAEIEAVEDASLESSTLVTVECKLFVVSIKFYLFSQTCPRNPSWSRESQPSKRTN